jgi:hypothetical protein
MSTTATDSIAGVVPPDTELVREIAVDPSSHRADIIRNNSWAE